MARKSHSCLLKSQLPLLFRVNSTTTTTENFAHNVGIQLTRITTSLSSWLATGKIFAHALASKGEGVGKPQTMLLRYRDNTLQRSCSLGKRADVPPLSPTSRQPSRGLNICKIFKFYPWSNLGLLLFAVCVEFCFFLWARWWQVWKFSVSKAKSLWDENNGVTNKACRTFYLLLWLEYNLRLLQATS